MRIPTAWPALALALALASLPAFAATAAGGAAVDLSQLDRGAAGPRAQVLVLGSLHLGQDMPAEFDPASLRPVLDRLAAFAPDTIAVEAISGANCDFMARYPKAYPAPVLDSYCADTADARKALALDGPAAQAQADEALRSLPAAPTPAQRRRLAALLLAAGEPASALAQWLQLAPAERRAGDGLDAAMAARLDTANGARDEGLQIGARLAARLGLQRVHAIDDHTGDNLNIADARAYGAAIQQAWDAAGASVRDQRARGKALREGGDMLALYRHLNDPARLRKEVAADAGAALREGSAAGYGRQYVAGWETRNLRMVANVREAFRERPGARVLVVVGSMHKPWFDALLGQMQAVDIVDAARALADPPR